MKGKVCPLCGREHPRIRALVTSAACVKKHGNEMRRLGKLVEKAAARNKKP